MKTLKYILFLFIFSFGIANAQQYRFKTTGYMVSQKDKKGKWGDFSKFKKSEMVVVLDTQKDRIVVYSEAIQLFNIMDYGEKKSTKTDDVVSFLCIDNLGVNCSLSIYTRKNKNNLNQLYIHYDDMVVVYNMVVIKDK